MPFENEEGVQPNGKGGKAGGDFDPGIMPDLRKICPCDQPTPRKEKVTDENEGILNECLRKKEGVGKGEGDILSPGKDE